MAVTKTATTIIASIANPAGGGPQVGTLDLTTMLGATITAKLTNGGTGPTVPATVTVNISTDNTNWKLFAAATGGVTASEIDEFVFQIPPTVMYVQVSIGGNTAQAVTVEALSQALTTI